MRYIEFAQFANKLPESRSKVAIASTEADIYSNAEGFALSRLPDGTYLGELDRITRSLGQTYKSYTIESWRVADQLETPEYVEFVAEMKEWLGVDTYFEICSDGRVSPQSMIGAGVGEVRKLPRGLTRTRASMSDSDVNVLSDFGFASTITNDVQKRQFAGELTPQPLLFRGPHIDLAQPFNGCGAAINRFKGLGFDPELAMQKDGGVSLYYADLGKGADAFVENTARSGAKGRVVEMTHDANADALLFGLDKAVVDFDPNKPFSDNVEEAIKSKKVISTEKLTDQMGDLIRQVALDNGYDDSLNFDNPRLLAKNMMTIARVAKVLVENHSEKLINEIPESVKNGHSDKTLEALMYVIFRNTAYRTLGNIHPGTHRRVHHNEALVSVGPVPAIYNRDNIPLTHKTYDGPFSPEDIQTALAFDNLFMDIRRHNKVDPSRIARIIEVNGGIDFARHTDEISLLRHINEVADVARHNASQIVERIRPAVLDGQAVVLACLRDKFTRRPIALVG